MDEGRQILFAFAAGVVAAFAADGLARWLTARRRRDLEAEPPRAALLALSYGMNPNRASIRRGQPGLETVIAGALLALRPGIESWRVWLFVGLALIGAPGAWLELRDYARRLTVRPAIVAHEEGLYLSGWRGTAFLPWPDVALAYTDPPDTGGYVADEQKAILRIESRSGRSWRFSSRDFPLGTPAEFDRLVELVTLRTAPPGSMLTRDTL
jgi:hypothetical protein